MVNLPIGGFQKQGLIDYPGHIASIVYTCGCNFRCSYCHNPELVLPKLIAKSAKLKSDEILRWIAKNKIMLDAIVITGGEPTLHGSLPDFIKQIKSLGLKVKLDTNGTNSLMLHQLISHNLVDYVAMDIKAPLNFEKYKEIVGNKLTNKLFKELIYSIEILQKNSINFEFRTTLDSKLKIDDIIEITNQVTGKLYFQKLHFNDKFIQKQKTRLSNSELEQLVAKCNDQLSIQIRE